MSWSPEIETLDQLLCGEMPLGQIRRFYESDETFTRGVLGLLREGDVRLLDQNRFVVQQWQWRELFENGQALGRLNEFWLEVTMQGARKVT